MSYSKKVGLLSFVATLAVGYAASRAFVAPAQIVTPTAARASRSAALDDAGDTFTLPSTLTTDPFFHENLDRMPREPASSSTHLPGAGRGESPVPWGVAGSEALGAPSPGFASWGLSGSGFEPARPEFGNAAPENPTGKARQWEVRQGDGGPEADKRFLCALHAVVDAGEPVAFLSVNGSPRRVRVGDELRKGLKVTKIEEGGIELRDGSGLVRLPVGGEAEL